MYQNYFFVSVLIRRQKGEERWIDWQTFGTAAIYRYALQGLAVRQSGSVQPDLNKTLKTLSKVLLKTTYFKRVFPLVA